MVWERKQSCKCGYSGTHTYIYFLVPIYNERLQVLIFKIFFKITVLNSWKILRKRFRNYFRFMETTRTGQLCDPLAIRMLLSYLTILSWNLWIGMLLMKWSISWFTGLLYDYSKNKENAFVWRKFVLKHSGTLPVYSQMPQKKKIVIFFSVSLRLKVF